MGFPGDTQAPPSPPGTPTSRSCSPTYLTAKSTSPSSSVLDTIPRSKIVSFVTTLLDKHLSTRKRNEGPEVWGSRYGDKVDHLDWSSKGIIKILERSEQYGAGTCAPDVAEWVIKRRIGFLNVMSREGLPTRPADDTAEGPEGVDDPYQELVFSHAAYLAKMYRDSYPYVARECEAAETGTDEELWERYSAAITKLCSTDAKFTKLLSTSA